MAQSIKNLPLGSKIKDKLGNEFTIIAFDHYKEGQTTLMHTSCTYSLSMQDQSGATNYRNSNAHYYLNNGYLSTIEDKLKDEIITTNIKYRDYSSSWSYELRSVNTKAFLISRAEVHQYIASDDVKPMSYFNTIEKLPHTWTRTDKAEQIGTTVSYNHYYYELNVYGGTSYTAPTYKRGIKPVFNISSDILISSNTEDGCYRFLFNIPPVISNISNFECSYGKAVDITYTATDEDDSNLTHSISFDNGITWRAITPVRNNNKYTYSYVFSEIGSYSCRIKVSDSALNDVVSNMFIVTISASSPIVNIVNVTNSVITFKASCQTHSISKVEIFVNNKVKETILNGFGFNVSYELNRNDLSVGKNAIQIKATSSEGLIGFANLEANKEVYELPPAGTKVVINDYEYLITKAVENEHLHTYTLDRNLEENVLIGDKIKIYQDRVKVLCSLSNSESFKDYKEMKLVKVKKLKGQFEGYIEEKYELEGEGRYSTIKLELERFNTSVNSEIIELQQHFDYYED